LTFNFIRWVYGLERSLDPISEEGMGFSFLSRKKTNIQLTRSKARLRSSFSVIIDKGKD
jgi:hypothetical protein